MGLVFLYGNHLYSFQIGLGDATIFLLLYYVVSISIVEIHIENKSTKSLCLLVWLGELLVAIGHHIAVTPPDLNLNHHPRFPLAPRNHGGLAQKARRGLEDRKITHHDHEDTQNTPISETKDWLDTPCITASSRVSILPTQFPEDVRNPGEVRQ